MNFYFWRRLSKIEKNPIFILGNQKSGTSIMVELIGRAANFSYVNDIPEIYEPVQTNLHNGKLDFKKFIEKVARDSFEKQIIKEPALSLLLPRLLDLYPNSKYVFIIRDPRDNIRSILNRLKVRGDLSFLDKNHSNLTPEWKNIVFNKWIGGKSDHYIESLAERWNIITDHYLSHREKCILVKYEDFNSDKEKYIQHLLGKLNLVQENDISSQVNVQYQSKGDHSISWETFFGLENLRKINEICAINMKILDYV